MEIIRKDHIWIKLFSVLLAITAGTVCLVWHDDSLEGNIARAAQAEPLKLVLKTSRVDYQGESLVKAVVQMDTEDAGVQAYSIYLDYDQDLLKPIVIYDKAGQYNQDYYQYEGLAMEPIVNYTQGHVNAQYASVNHTIDRAGSILFIAYFQVIAAGEGSAEIWITEESTFTGAASDHSNKTIRVAEDSVLDASVRLGEQKENVNTSESVISGEQFPDSNYHYEDNIEDSNPSDIQNTTASQGTENNAELTQDKNYSVEDQSDQQENSMSGDIKNETVDNKENNSTSTDLKKKKIKLNKSKAVIKVGKTLKLKVINTTEKIKWSSNKKKIASVDNKGKVKAKKAGIAVIRAKIKGGDLLKCRVIVKGKQQNYRN